VQQPIDKDKLKARYEKEFKQIIEDLIKGKANAKANAEAVDVAAQWFVYRVTWTDYQTTPGAISGSHGVMSELDQFLADAAKNKPATTPLLEMFSERVAEHAKKVLQNDKPVARVNGARILARLAEAGQEEVADVLAETVKDPQQPDGVKYYALKGIKELFANASLPTATVFKLKTGMEREVRCLSAVGAAVNRKTTIAEDMPRDEKEGIRVMEREAVRALAMNRRPAVADDSGAMVESPALTLLRVARVDGVLPEPRMDARVDAAAGVARMSSKAFDGYQPDYAAYQLGWFIADFAQAQATNTPAKEPWKVEAAKLSDAFGEMKTQSAKLKEGKYIGEVADHCLEVISKIEVGGSGDPGRLVRWLGANAPVNTSLYRGVADAIIRDGSKEATAKPPDKDPAAKPPESDKK
jgi:hypothetical protein